MVLTNTCRTEHRRPEQLLINYVIITSLQLDLGRKLSLFEPTTQVFITVSLSAQVGIK